METQFYGEGVLPMIQSIYILFLYLGMNNYLPFWRLQFAS